jgi:hypothetical protein
VSHSLLQRPQAPIKNEGTCTNASIVRKHRIQSHCLSPERAPRMTGSREKVVYHLRKAGKGVWARRLGGYRG